MKKVAFALAFAVSCASVATPPQREWQQWSDPASAGFDVAKIAEICPRADAAKSGALMVIANGNVVTACGDVARKLELHSVRKSIYAALYGIAVDKGLIRLDATLGELGIDDLQPLSDVEKRARVEDLLLARSGIYHRASYAPSDQDQAPARGTFAPGTNWFYNNWDFNVAGVLLERATGKKLGALVDEWIAKPTGMQDFVASDVTEIYEPRSSKWPALTIRMSTRDLARFGQLWLADGIWNSRRILPAGWVARASTGVSKTGNGGEYGMMWWIQPAAGHRIVSARGTGGQFIGVIPSANMVVVHRGDTDHGREVRGPLVWELVEMALAAQTRTPVASAKTMPLAPVALTSQLAPVEWPQPVTLDDATRNALAGDYRLGPGRIATIYIFNGRLFGHVPQLGDAELLPKSATEFYIRADPSAQVIVGDGKLTLRMRGREMVGEKQ